MSNSLYNTKIKINDSEHSKKVQEYLFSRGVHWNHYGDYEVRFTDEPILCISSTLELSYCDNPEYFNDISYKEINPLSAGFKEV